jgi:hypothetical protein
MLPRHLERNPDELEKIHKLISAGGDHPVLMINENAYTRASGYPDGEPYRRYMAGLEDVVQAAGGAILWRVYLDVPLAEGGDENYRLRALCVERALIHRCPGGSVQPAAGPNGAAAHCQT